MLACGGDQRTRCIAESRVNVGHELREIAVDVIGYCCLWHDDEVHSIASGLRGNIGCSCGVANELHEFGIEFCCRDFECCSDVLHADVSFGPFRLTCTC